LYNDIVGLVATEDDIEKLRERLSEVSDWIYDEGEHADTPVYASKLKELQSIEQPIQFRVREYVQRPKNIDLVQSTSKVARDFIDSIRAKSEELRYHTEEELEGLSNAVEKVEKWMAEQVAAQKKLLETEEPVLVTSKVQEKVKTIEEQLMKLLGKKKPKVQPKKEPVVPKNDTEEEATNDQSETEGSKDSQVPPASDDDRKHDEL
jgi:hypoxia up-regulated 1